MEETMRRRRVPRACHGKELGLTRATLLADASGAIEIPRFALISARVDVDFLPVRNINMVEEKLFAVELILLVSIKIGMAVLVTS